MVTSTDDGIGARYASSEATSEREAAADLASILEVGPPPELVLFFCSPKYDLAALGAELKGRFGPVQLVGCTSSGQIDRRGFRTGGVSAAAISGTSLRVHTHLIEGLSKDCEGAAALVGEQVMAERARLPSGWRSFGLLLVDGLSLVEERLCASLYCALGDVPIVGGSAGDDLEFRSTHVFGRGAFRRDAAVLVTFSTPLPFKTFKAAHFSASDQMLVVTGADPASRTIFEIDGEPATDAYARLLGTTPDRLDRDLYSRHPLAIEIGGEAYFRSISRVSHSKKTLHLFCGVDEGTVLSIAESVDAIASLERAFAAVRSECGAPSLVLGCDCVLRRIEFEQREMMGAIGGILAENRVFGFSTYGEQLNGVHMNQTFTGVAIGSTK